MPRKPKSKRPEWAARMWWTNKEERSCAGKQRHESRADANSHRLALIRKDKVKRVLNVYQCYFCDGWHVGGSQPRPKPKD